MAQLHHLTRCKRGTGAGAGNRAFPHPCRANFTDTLRLSAGALDRNGFVDLEDYLRFANHQLKHGNSGQRSWRHVAKGLLQTAAD